MGYKATCSFSAGKGLDYAIGQSYDGPSELIEQLVSGGLLVEDKAVNVEPKAIEESFVEDLAEELEEKPKKAPKKKGK